MSDVANTLVYIEKATQRRSPGLRPLGATAKGADPGTGNAVDREGGGDEPQVCERTQLLTPHTCTAA